MHPHQRFSLVLVVAALLLSGLHRQGVGASQGAQQQCFPETGQCVDEPFLTYWREHGGLAINGFPLSAAHPEVLEDGQVYRVQYFERSRLEYHPENAGTPYEVLLGQFGRLIRPADPPADQQAGQAYFTETGHNLGGVFLAYWVANGGLAQFGFPTTEESRERLENGQTYTVQYFERARFEYHPEGAGTPYTVLLGQFGRRVLTAVSPVRPPLPYPMTGLVGEFYENNAIARVRLGLPTATAVRVDGVTQPFQRGAMVYRGDTRTILVLARDDNGRGGDRWLSFLDTWDESQPAGGGATPVPGLFYTQRGFGKVWRDNAEVQQRLGAATTPNEQGVPLLVQPFESGLLVMVLQTYPGSEYVSYEVYLLYHSGRLDEYRGYGRLE